MQTVINDQKKVSVIGLGNMGKTIADLLVHNNYDVTVWNRTRDKAELLVKKGAKLAASADAAIGASPVTIICVFDYKATNDILDREEVKAKLVGKTLIQLSTGSPKEARDAESWLHSLGAEYLDGAIQVAPEQMGQTDTPILISGRKEVFEKYKTLLNVLAGNLVYLGDKIDLASNMDLATLSTLYGTILGFIHGARISEAAGFDINHYSSIVTDIFPTFAEFIRHEGSVIQSGNFQVSQSPMSISVEATERILQAAKEAGINADFPAYAAGVLKKAKDAGYENEELAAIIKVLR